MPIFIIGQLMALLNGFFLLKSMRTNNKSKFLLLNSTSNLFGCLSMLILGAYAASIGPIVLTIQGIVTHMFERKGKKQPKWLLLVYIMLNIIGGMLTINSLISVLPVVSSSLACVMLMCKEVKTSRKINLLSSILALPYLILNKAYVSALIFGSSFINTLDAIRKYDLKSEDTCEIAYKPAEYIKDDEINLNNLEETREIPKELFENDFLIENELKLSRRRKKGKKKL